MTGLGTIRGFMGMTASLNRAGWRSSSTWRQDYIGVGLRAYRDVCEGRYGIRRGPLSTIDRAGEAAHLRFARLYVQSGART